ncbi:MAG: hypothetical protein JRF33_20380 [Deltaproteobacteria bacterium]|nr:hypothetical protein [Deltaproteobacteria bacterium]
MDSWPVRADEAIDPQGVSPVALELDSSRGRLYVAAAQSNSIEVLSLADGSHLGSIPAGWYPTDVILSPDGQKLLVLNGKGEGSGPKMPGIPGDMRGSLSIMDVPGDSTLVEGLDQVRANNAYPTTFFPERCTGKFFPVPRALGEPSPIKHVIFILRENKTYDQNLGDLEGADGDPSLVMFGETITPNLHALAREFCNLDNFHAEIEVSVQGHYWNVASTINDFSEKVWHAGYRDSSRVPSTGTMQPDYPIGDFIWHKLQDAGIDFRNYGEPLGLAGEYERFADHVNMDYMLDLAQYLYDKPDAEKAQVFLDEVEAGIFPPFVYLALLNDHTWGGSAGKPTPQWMVAENDYATGLVVDTISRGPYWHETLIIITEDDPQSGADHVDSHRSIALLVSPYTRKGFTSSVHHGFSSLIRTYGLILGMPPLNMMDAQAAPVNECFTSQPDFSPYELRPMQVEYALNPTRSPASAASEHMDFSKPDRAAGLGAVLWWATRPGEPLPPELANEKAALDASLRRALGPRGALDYDDDEEEEERRALPIPYGWKPWNEINRKDGP